MSLKQAREFLEALWMIGAADANYPASPGGQVPTLQTDGTVKWSTGAGGGGEPLVDDASGEILFDDATGDILIDG
jgi:hypothetical protein